MNRRAQITIEEVVERVMTGLQQKRPSCFLLEAPPGCEEPDAITRIQEVIVRDRDLNVLCTTVTADAVRNDEELVESLIRGWLESDPSIRKLWSSEEEHVADLPIPQRLKAFFNACVTDTGRWRLALVRRFDRVFRRMSGELLAVMRDLEHELQLITINTSPLPYGELYRRRTREEPGFTSDYGQVHVRLTIGPLPREMAQHRWKEDYGLPLHDRLSRAYFEVAYELSGALPAAFAKAAGYARHSKELNPDITVYRAELAERLPEAFERLLSYDEDEVNVRLVCALARMQLGIATVLDRQFVGGHRWHFLFIDQSQGEPRLRSEALGRKALEMVRKSGQEKTVDPHELYQYGQYLACCGAIEEMGLSGYEVLSLAAKMMAEAFGDGPICLYFGPRVRWYRLRQLAREAASKCQEGMGGEEFDRWERIAGAHEIVSRSKDVRARIELGRKGETNLGDLENMGILLAARLIAVARDKNAVTAAYTAIPLAEDILRHYVCLVLNLPTQGSSFERVDRQSIDEWWQQPKAFKPPDKTERLSGTDLAVLAAVLSAQRGKPLFSDPADLSRFLGLLDERNISAHHVMTPTEHGNEDLTERTTMLIDRMFESGGSRLTVKEIESWFRAPIRFLMGRPGSSSPAVNEGRP